MAGKDMYFSESIIACTVSPRTGVYSLYASMHTATYSYRHKRRLGQARGVAFGWVDAPRQGLDGMQMSTPTPFSLLE
jgi:hypothetical protein